VFKNFLMSIPDPFASRVMMLGGNKDTDRVNWSSPQWKAMMVFTAGALAGITATAATYPFDIMRTQFALQGPSKVYNSIPSYVNSTLKNQGVRAFYTGLGPAVIGVAPYMGLNFAIYEGLTKYLETRNRNKNNINNAHNSHVRFGDDATLLSSPREENAHYFSGLVKVMKNGAIGGLAGGASKFLVFPFDTVKRRLQAQVLMNTFELTVSDVLAGGVIAAASSSPRYSGLVDCVQNIWKYEGIKGFYKGIIPTTAKSITATAITFAAYEVSKDFLNKLSLAENNTLNASR